MLQDRLTDYSYSLKIKDKASYLKAASWCAEYFDKEGIASPSAEDWEGFTEYVRQEYFKEKGRMPNDRTVKQNYEGRAKLFMKWNAEQGQALQSPQAVRSYTPMQTVKVMLDGERYEVLSMLAIMEHRTLPELLNDAASLYIEAHAEKAAIMQEAIKQAQAHS